MKKHAFLYLIIFIEGYIVLSSELLAIRQTIPFIGSGTDTTAIIISAVLLPLALGYYVGGNFNGKSFLNKKRISIRGKLLQNIFISSFFLILGLSYFIISDFFQATHSLITKDRVLSTTLYAAVFLITPVFLLGQTIPLVSHYFKQSAISSTTGKMLFFSTIGSLMGGVFSTLVLMNMIGVNMTAVITITCCTILYLLLSKRKVTKKSIIIILLAFIAFYINSSSMMKKANIISSNTYNTISISHKKNGSTLMKLNNVAAASINREDLPFQYMSYIERNFINPIKTKGEKKSILVIGSGGFTLGLGDIKNDYLFIDIDDSLKDISEQYFLKRKLSKNKKFSPIPARAFLQQAQKENRKFDLIVVDTYIGFNIPMQLITKEFFTHVKNTLNNNGIATMNIIASPSFTDKFSLNVDNTLRSVFPNINRDIIGHYNGWSQSPNNARNVIYSYYHAPTPSNKIYIDDNNDFFRDYGTPVINDN